ncbi:vWA domain-containing protein [Kaarinaea lacus]
MKLTRKYKLPVLLTIAALAVPVSMAYLAVHAAQSNPESTHNTLFAPQHQPRIQLAILLDTSSSMDGLIDQARQQIWQVVNEFSTAKQNGIKPVLEVAVFEYGNSGLPASSGYIRQVSPLTRELDQVSEALFSLTTNGGDEYCGMVIQNAVQQLEWSKNKNDIRAIFIAGNEPFTQGPTPFREAIAAAKNKGIVVNTIHAGKAEEGARTGWKDGAMLAGGNYLSIDANHKVVYIKAPQDEKIAELNSKLNQTYIPYGVEGKEKQQRQTAQDTNTSSISAGLLAKRAKSKASAYYDNSSWDLVDAHNSGKLDLDKVKKENLPAPMQEMNKEERKKYVEEAAAGRKVMQQEILKLSKEREAYVAEQKKQQASASVATVEDALIGAVRKQGQEKKFEFESN